MMVGFHQPVDQPRHLAEVFVGLTGWGGRTCSLAPLSGRWGALGLAPLSCLAAFKGLLTSGVAAAVWSIFPPRVLVLMTQSAPLLPSTVAL